MNNGRQAYVEFVPGQKGVSGSYNEIRKFLTKDQYEALKSSGEPVVVQETPAVQAAPAAPPTNGAPVPSAGVSLPPALSAAQNIVS